MQYTIETPYKMVTKNAEKIWLKGRQQGQQGQQIKSLEARATLVALKNHNFKVFSAFLLTIL